MLRGRAGITAAALALAVGLVLSLPVPSGAASTVVYQEKTEGYDCFRVPAVVQARNKDLLAFAEGRRGGSRFCADAGNIDIVVKRSTDGGHTWGPLQVVVRGDGDTRGNPTPIVLPSTGRIVLLSTAECVRRHPCGRAPQVQDSDDNGHSWMTPHPITSELGFTRPPGWLATGPGHGIVLDHGPHAGRLLAGLSYNLGMRYTGAVIYSDDQGATWRTGATTTSESPALQPQELSLAELPGDRVYVAARNQAGWAEQCLAGGTRNRADTVATDGGTRFARGFAFNPGLVTPTVQAPVLGLGAVVVFAGPSVCGARARLTVRSSIDDGAHWRTEEMVWPQAAAYSDLVALGPDDVGLLYEAGPAGRPNATIRWSTVDTPEPVPDEDEPLA
ncbi:exo-alpha-sialidase [Amycolatopsis sp. GM8]|uniref:sialidase family protein n=1 Tax=Amycolatopsis sp. GM8 TaxID=2896530 RepID=UPI001F20FB42|nr:sialidase family protein [Amycolatopsis sp. GM8]